MDAEKIQSLSYALQPMFAAVFLYHALVVRKFSRVELSVPYAYIVPMSLAASGHYFFWKCYSLVQDAHDVRIVGHLIWICAALMIYFHVGALEAFFQPCPRWISRAKSVLLALVAPAALSLLALLSVGWMLLFSPEPMTAPPLAFPVEIRDRIHDSFSINSVSAALAIVTLLTEIACFAYFLRRALKKRGDRWLAFGLCLMVMAIVNDITAALRPDSPTTSFLFVAIFVEIVRLTTLIEKANRERLLRVENSMRLSQIGEMTATVAHELVNPLTIILGNVEAGLKTKSLDRAGTERVLQKIHLSATRMSTLVRGLRDHARQVDPVVEPIPVAQALEDAAEMLRPIYSRNGIELRLEIAPGLPPIRGDRGKLQQILVNLLQNASDATEGRESRRIALSASLEENSLRVRVSDNGCGIPAELISKVFTPYFTTKPRGKGTGIGLSFVASQVKAMKGDIQIRSSEPGNTAFELLFPIQS